MPIGVKLFLASFDSKYTYKFFELIRSEESNFGCREENHRFYSVALFHRTSTIVICMGPVGDLFH